MNVRRILIRTSLAAATLLASQAAFADDFTATIAAGHPPVFRWVRMMPEAFIPTVQEELAGTENKISYIRTAYNDSVLSYDNALEMFPSNIIAGIFGFKARAYFEAPEGEKAAVKVKF